MAFNALKRAMDYHLYAQKTTRKPSLISINLIQGKLLFLKHFRVLRFPFFIIFMGLFHSFLIGCNELSTPNKTSRPSTGITFTDDAGRIITLNAPAKRIVAGSSFSLELLMAINHPPVLRPDVPDHKIHPTSAKFIPSLSIEHGAGPDLETIAMADSDLIILHINFLPFAENISKALNIPVALLEIRSVESVLHHLELLGRITGKTKTAAVQIATLEARITKVISKDPMPKLSVLPLFGTPEAFYGYRKTSYLGSMIDILGMQNLTANKAAFGRMHSISPLNLELIVGSNPEVILIVPHGPPQAVLNYLSSHPAWSKLDAVQTGRVHILDEVLFSSNPGPRAPEALTKLKELLNPSSP
tara:strand:+ start:1985 stop:3058 length:1074 start_codon:yes stop_codon:yes gene_type:complete